MSDRCIVVVSRYWPTALSVVRSLGAAGYTVDLVSSCPKEGDSFIASSSKYVRHSCESVYRTVKQSDDPKLIENLLAYKGSAEELILLPTDDYTASFIDRNRAELDETFVMPFAREPIYELMNKSVQSQKARSAGLNVPLEWVVSLDGDIHIPDDMVYPCFVKPMESFSGFKGEMKRCGSYEELSEHLSFLQSRMSGRSILVQEFLNIEGEYDVQGICSGKQVIIPAVIKKTGIAKLERGVTMSGVMEPIDALGDTYRRIVDFLKEMDYTGMFDLELNLVGNEFYFGELNLRSGGPNFAYYLNGVNLPDLCVRALIGETIVESHTRINEYGKSFVYEKVVWKEYLKGYLGENEKNRILTEADYKLIGSSDDAEPIRLFDEENRTAEAKKKPGLKKLIKRKLRPFAVPVKEFLKGYPQRLPGNGRHQTKPGERPRAMVVGRNYCSNICMARSLGMAGYEVEVLRIANVKRKNDPETAHIEADAYSRYIKAYYKCTRKEGGKSVADKLIEIADKNSKMILFPTEDVAAYIVDEYYDKLKEFYYLPDINNKQGEIKKLMSKELQLEEAKNAGLRTANGVSIKITNGTYEIPEGITYPCFIKPDVSRTTSKTRMRRCDSRAELDEALGGIAADRDLDVIVEDYIDIKREISVLGLSCEDGVICPGVFEVVSGGNESRRGVSITGRILPPDSIGELQSKLTEYVKALNYTGLFDIDLIESADGTIYFVEINLRYGASGFALTECGVNLPGMLADYMTINGTINLNARPDETGKIFVSEKVVLEEYLDGYMTASEAHEIIDKADINFIKDKNDMKSYKKIEKFIR